jgi:hypothetical protein
MSRTAFSAAPAVDACFIQLRHLRNLDPFHAFQRQTRSGVNPKPLEEYGHLGYPQSCAGTGQRYGLPLVIQLIPQAISKLLHKGRQIILAAKSGIRLHPSGEAGQYF